MKITINRHIYKTISYRIIGTILTMVITYLFTDNFTIAYSFGFVEILVKPIVYFLHERVWYKWIKIGLKQNN